VAARQSAKTAKAGPARDGRTLRRQGEATRAKLLAAAEPALAQNGWHATRVDDVVRLAGVSHGTFYLYFANKEDLFRALAERCADDAAELAASLGPVDPGPDGLAALRAWVSDFVAFYGRNGVVIRAWSENQVGDRKLARLGTTSFGRISTTLRASLTDGDGEPSRQVELRAAALLAMLERFAYVITSRDLGFDRDAAIDNLALVAHRGFFRPAQ
jgi:AcrR family transcriptional regulator